MSDDDERTEIRIVFDDPDEREYTLPLNLAGRRITHVDVGGVRYVPQRRSYEERDFIYLTD